MVPWGRTTTISPARSAASASRRGRSDPLPRSTRIPPIATRHPTERGGLEKLLLAEKADRASQPSGDQRQGHDVEIAPVIGRQQDRTALGHDLQAPISKRA